MVAVASIQGLARLAAPLRLGSGRLGFLVLLAAVPALDQMRVVAQAGHLLLRSLVCRCNRQRGQIPLGVTAALQASRQHITGLAAAALGAVGLRAATVLLGICL